MPAIDSPPPVRHMSWPSQDEVAAIKAKVAADASVDVSRVLVAYSPYRVCPLGAHVDHQGGLVSASAIDLGVVLAFVPTEDSTVRLTSSAFDATVRFAVDNIPPALRTETPEEPCCWGNFPRGAAFALTTSGYKVTKGICGHLWSPAGLDSSGISSSAAVGVAYLLALEAANGLQVTPADNIELDRVIENTYLGLKNGILDQSAILLSQPDFTLTVVDCRARQWRHVPPPWSTPPIRALLVFSGLRAALASGASFNTRVAECHDAAQQLARLTGTHTDKAQPLLGDFSQETFEEHREALGDVARRRAEHFFTETQRVAQGAELWAGGRLEEFGTLMKQSGLSSINNYEVGTPQLIALQRALHECPGVLGARFSGAGTRGACVALVEASQADAAAVQVMQRYVEEFPEMRGAAQAIVCMLGAAARVQGAFS